MTEDLNTLICLFHHQDYAQTALEEILEAGIPESNVTLIGAPGSNIEASRSSLAELNVPEKDLKHLLEGVIAGGAVLSVSAISADSDKVESIFAKHRADKIDEADVADDRSADAIPVAPLVAGAPAIPLSATAADVDDYPEDTGSTLGEDTLSAQAPLPSQGGELLVIEQDLLLVEDPALSTPGTTAFDVIPVTVIPLDTQEMEKLSAAPAEQPASVVDSHDENGKPDLDPREMGFDARMQPVMFSPQVH